ncbi:SIR2 family protein [Pseudomonas sp.]|uniref:SIR2 family protein n=1 Tax=Pseudomonas sp. TaxID=306 RepID=UPI002ED8F985
MNIINLQDPGAEAFLQGLIASERNVPFIGTGFTRGERASSKAVPNGDEWMAIMARQISLSKVSDDLKPSSEELKKYNFQDLSDVYFGEEIIPLPEIKSTLAAYFSGVRFSNQAKKSFLSIGWPYLYTLNIDDAIEKEINGVKVLPFEPFARSAGRPYVYKIHGDVDTALKAVARNDLKLIFGSGDYVRSLKKNIYLIETLTNDLLESNLIFIGCSLTDELDILYALSDLDGEKLSPTTKRVYVTSSTPTEFSIKKKLRDYGITDVLVCDYESFYLKYVELYRSEKSANNFDSSYLFNNLTKIELTNKSFLNYFLQIDGMTGNISALTVPRTLERKIIDAVSQEPVCVIHGARFSGRTSLLHRILDGYATKRSFLIGSEVSLSDNSLNDILSYRNSFIVFDVGSLTNDQIRHVTYKAEALRDRNSTVLMAISTIDLNATHLLDFDTSVFRLPDKFDRLEIAQLNSAFDFIGIARLDRKGRLLDHIYEVSNSSVALKTVGSKIPLQERINQRVTRMMAPKISTAEFSLLYILAARQKVYSLNYRAILKAEGHAETTDERIQMFAGQWQPFAEISHTDRLTGGAVHSNFVLLSNSQAWMHFAIKFIVNKIGIEDASAKIVHAVTVLKGKDPNYYELVMFDVLNAVFSAESQIGVSSRKLISSIYEKLAPLQGSEPNYWLQRAKSIYHVHSGNTVQDVIIAIEYAGKAISDTEDKVTINGWLTRANLYGLLCKVDGYTSETYILQAIEMYSQVLQTYSDNEQYVGELIAKSNDGRGYLRDLIEAADRAEKSLAFLNAREGLNYLHGLIASPKYKRR